MGYKFFNGASMLEYIVYGGVILVSAGAFFYIKDTLQGKNQPNRVTWLLWAIAPMIGTWAAVSNGVGISVLPVFMAGFVPFLIFLASFVNPKAYWKLERFDYVCGAFSLFVLVLWGVTHNPVATIAFAILSDALAAIPTIIKSWKYPESETAAPFILGSISLGVGFLVMKEWSFVELAFPVYLLLLNLVIVLAIVHTRKKS